MSFITGDYPSTFHSFGYSDTDRLLCPECDGYGCITLACGEESDCPNCSGSGYRPGLEPSDEPDNGYTDGL